LDVCLICCLSIPLLQLIKIVMVGRGGVGWERNWRAGSFSCEARFLIEAVVA